jgi:hypothetical protein
MKAIGITTRVIATMSSLHGSDIAPPQFQKLIRRHIFYENF